jgi:5-methylthioadenosine/S-adenosylhomocysteine deaminase
MLDTLIFNAAVVTVNRRFDIHRPGLIGIRRGRIAVVGPWSPEGPLPDSRSSIDAGGAIVLPGLVNAHTHLPMVLFRGLADDLALMDWLTDVVFPAESVFIHPETVAPSVRLACAELLLSGTTTCCDGYFHADGVADAVRSSGVRGVVGQGVIDHPAPGVPDPARNVEAAVSFVRRWIAVDPMITPSIFCHSPYTCSVSTLERSKAEADSAGVRFQIHVAETRSEVDHFRKQHGTTPVGYLNRIGVLDQQTQVIHGVWLTASDIDILAERGCPVIHCPESNMKLGSGVAPVPQLLEAGVTVALGTDGPASNNDMDLFREMDTAAKLHKLVTGNPTVLPAQTILRMATLDAAAAVGLEREVGSLAIGKAADLIVCDPNLPASAPAFHPDSQIVYALDGSCVTDVMVGGRWQVKDRRLVHMDVDALSDEVGAIARRIRAAVL